MGKLIGKLIINALALWIVAQIVPGFFISGWAPLLVGTVILAIVNTFLKPILVLLSLPISIVTFGLFIFVINAAILGLVAYFVEGFDILDFWPTAIISSILLSLVSTALNYFVKSSR